MLTLAVLVVPTLVSWWLLHPQKPTTGTQSPWGPALIILLLWLAALAFLLLLRQLDLRSRLAEERDSQQRLLKAVMDAATDKGLAFLTALPSDVPIVLGDPLRLRQVINNVLGNALKFTPQGSITLRLHAQETGEDVRLRWTVEDMGIGMTPAVLPRLFKPFTQADAGITRQYGGTGLGFALSYELLRLMGGTIQVESTPNKGSAFTMEVRLPKA